MGILTTEFKEELKNFTPESLYGKQIISLESNPRRKNAILEFYEHANRNNSTWFENKSSINDALHQYKNNLVKLKSIRTAYSDYSRVRGQFANFKRSGLIPHNTILPNNFGYKNVNNSSRLTNYLLATTNPMSLSSIESTEIEYLDALEVELRQNLELLKSYSQKIIFDSYSKFLLLDKLIASSDIDEIEEDGDHLDPNQVTKQKQKLSYFSKAHPNGLANCVAYIYKYKNRMFVRSSFSGSHHFYEHGIENILCYLGLSSELIVAMMNVIIDEVGINITPLINQKVNTTQHHEFIKINPCGSIVINTLKKRAKIVQPTKLDATWVESLPDVEDLSSTEINAEFAIKFALLVNEYFIDFSGENYSFLTIGSDSSGKGVRRVSKMAIKSIIKKFAGDISEDLSELSPTMAGIRASKGVLIWLENDGDSVKAARYLRNKIQTTLNNYIPKELQELKHRKRIRKFQSLLSVLNALSANKPNEYLDVDAEEYKKILEGFFLDDDTDGWIIDGLISKADGKSEEIIFRVSQSSIAHLIQAAREHQDKNIQKKCKSIIDLIGSNGSRKMKKMLSQANKQANLNVKNN